MTGNIWIIVGIIAAAIAAFAIPYGFHLQSKQQDKPSTYIAGDYVSGPKVSGGDFIAGDKTTNIGPNAEELEAIFRRVLKESHPTLSKSFSDERAVFGISNSGFVVPKGDVPTGLEVRWDTGRVLKVTDKMFTVLLPDIIANTTHIKNFSFGGNKVSLPKKVGAQMGLLKTKDFIIKVEVVGLDKNLVVVGLGLAPPN